MIRAENIRFVLGYVIDNDVPVQVVPACKELDALEAERDRYREALALLGKWAEESLGETPATQHPVLDAGSVLDLVNKTLLK